MLGSVQHGVLAVWEKEEGFPKAVCSPEFPRVALDIVGLTFIRI